MAVVPTTSIGPVRPKMGPLARTRGAAISLQHGSVALPDRVTQNEKDVRYLSDQVIGHDVLFDQDLQVPNLIASGPNAQAGIAPLTPSTIGTTKFLCEDATWKNVDSSGLDIRAYGAKWDGVTNDSAAFVAAMAALPATGGVILLPQGIGRIASTLTIGDGTGVTQSTKNNITLRGMGASSGNASYQGATTIKWSGGASTMVKAQGPIRCVILQDLVLDGNSVATIIYDELACNHGRLDNVVMRNVAAGGIVHRMDAVADLNGNCAQNMYTNVTCDASALGAVGLSIGPTALAFNAGTFLNTFVSYSVSYANDVLASCGMILGWADNNVFINCEFSPVATPGAGIAVKHVRQSGSTYDFLPSENIFLHCYIGGTTSVGFSGDSGRGVGTIVWPYQVLDSGGLPTSKNLRGFLDNGDFFDTSGKMSFQNIMTLYARAALSMMQVLGFARSTGTGTVTITGTAVVGSGTNFTGQLAVGRMIAISNEFRRVTAIADNTHATIVSAFTDDSPAGTGFDYQIGANGFMYADGDLNLGTYDASELHLWTNGVKGGVLDSTGNLSAIGKVTGNASSTTFSNAGGNTMSAAQLINGQVIRSAGGAQTDTTPTATAIVNAISNCQIGQAFMLGVYNNSGGLHTLGLGSGVTIASGFTSVLTTTAGNAHQFIFRVTATGTPAVEVYSQGQAAY